MSLSSSALSLRRVVAALPLLALGVSAALAEDPPVTLTSTEPLVISATRLPTPEDEVGSSVTVITADDIARKQRRTLPDVLQDVPGLNVVQSGGAGGSAAVFMRGANANHTKVLIDGIDANDPSTPDGAFNFAHILASDIERVEVLRGPQSGLYGSDAIGGVINIITKTGSGPPHFTGSLEGGSFGTFNQTAGASGSVSRFNYAFDLAHYRSADTPVTPTNLLPPGQAAIGDTYENSTLSTKFGVDLGNGFDAGLVARYSVASLHSTADDDQMFGFPDASQSAYSTRQLFTRATVHQVGFDGAFEQTFGLGYTDYRSRSTGPGFSPSLSDGDRIKLDWQGAIKVLAGETVVLGAEHQIDQIRNSPSSAQTTNDGGFVELQSSFGPRLFNSVSVRLDDNSRFGTRPTFREAPAFLIPETGTKLKASIGTGFKAPSLEQLFVSFPSFNFFANPNLKPETSTGYDAGFEQSFLQKRVQFGATYFHNDIKNLIAANPSFTTDINIGHATTYGVESFASYKVLSNLSLRADYTYTMATDDVLHQELLRRPKHKASAEADWQPTDAASLTATVLYVGSWIDGSRDFSIPRLSSGSYTVVNLAGSYDISKGLTALARIDNLLDRRYQDPVGFLRPGLGIFVGLRASFDMLAGGK